MNERVVYYVGLVVVWLLVLATCLVVLDVMP